LSCLILFFGFRPAEGFRLLFQSSHARHPVQPGVNYRSGSGSGDIGEAGIPWEEIKLICNKGLARTIPNKCSAYVHMKAVRKYKGTYS
jgi:hypothetical protein